MNIDSIKNGLVIDHIRSGKSMEIYKYLNLESLDCQVAIIKNASSKRMGKKDIIKIDAELDVDVDALGYIDPNITVNIIKNGVNSSKIHPDLPEKITDIIKCSNPRCITSVEQEIHHIFKLTDKEKVYTDAFTVNQPQNPENEYEVNRLNYKEISKIVNAKLNRNELVEIFRYGIDDMSILAQVCSLSQDLMCCRFASDFSFDGYKIFRNKDISEIVLCDKNENMKFISSVFKKENLFINEKFEFNTKSWQTLLNDLMHSKKAISIECSFEDAIDYYVGWITKIENNIITVRCIDGSGYIFKDEIKVNSDFISAISIYDRYTEYMTKYARNL